MRLVVTGTRDGHPRAWYWLDLFVTRRGAPELVILGDARGVDRQAWVWARARGFSYERLVAHWERLGRARAGGERNQRMVDLAAPGDWLLAFPGPDSVGTWDCVGRARSAGLQVAILPWPG